MSSSKSVNTSKRGNDLVVHYVACVACSTANGVSELEDSQIVVAHVVSRAILHKIIDLALICLTDGIDRVA